MTKLIPYDLIKHLEWNKDSKGEDLPPRGKKPTKTDKLHINDELAKYIQVGIQGLNGNSVVISPFELVGFGGLEYTRAHSKLIKNGLYMPTPKIFMTHFMNVVEAHKGNKKLLYADNTEVEEEVVEDMFKHYTTNHKSIYGGDEGVWTWLNARFVKGSGFNGLDLETIIGKEGKKPKTFKEPLVDCLGSDSLAQLEFNEQGLAIKQSRSSDYKKGKNIYFYSPAEDSVAGFGANSSWALLGCDGDPTFTNPSLGVFGCAEGTSAPKK